jgi:hypothetical protein
MEQDFNEAIERLDLKNEMISNVTERLIDTLKSIDPTRYSMDKIRERVGLKPLASIRLLDQMSALGGSSNGGRREEEDEAMVL